MRRWLLCCIAVVCVVLSPLARSQNLNATNEMNLGLGAYRHAKYLEAIDHLERALALDPALKNGHLYLARAYFEAYVDSPECDEDACAANEYVGARGMEEFQKVLAEDPDNIEALKALAWRNFRQVKFGEAERYYRRAIEVAPNDVDSLYPLAVLLWTESYQDRQQGRVALKLKAGKPLIDLPACAEIRSGNLSRVEESLALLQRWPCS